MKINTTVSFLFSFFLLNVTFGQTIEFYDDFESGSEKWTVDGTWATGSEMANGGSFSLTDSPFEDYPFQANFSAMVKDPIDLTNALDASLSFDVFYDLQDDKDDRVFVEVSNNNGVDWTEIAHYSGNNNSIDWETYQYSIGFLAGFEEVRIRFRITSDCCKNYDGVYIDNFIVTSYAEDNSGPVVFHQSPEFYDCQEGDVSISAQILDPSGVSSATLNYSVDGKKKQPLVGINSSDSEWNFIIPATEAGAQIDYYFTSIDDSDKLYSQNTSTFSYIAGRHEYHDNGEYLGLVYAGPDAGFSRNGYAVKFVLSNRRLSFMLIRNFFSQFSSNSPMKIHVWKPDLSGLLPGEDLIPPFLVSPEASIDDISKMTRVDFREFEELKNLTGTVFVGFTAPEGRVNVVNTLPAEAVKSYYLNSSGSWKLDQNRDLHFRIVTDEAITTNVDDIDFDSSIKLYPNPSPGNTQLKFNMENSRDLDIEIFNQLGQLMSFTHFDNVSQDNIDLNTSTFTSGVYYVSISDGKVRSSKKLIKQ